MSYSRRESKQQRKSTSIFDLLGQEVMESMLAFAQQSTEQRQIGSKVFDEEREAAIPRFDMSEIRAGPILGRGGFCDVSEVLAITLLELGQEEKKDRMEESSVHNEFTDRHTREFIASHVIRDGDARYAMKELSSKTKADGKRFVQGTVDLALEAKFLAVLEHPNIIKMRGMVAGDIFKVERSFIVLDRLYATMTEKLNEWKKREKRASKFFMIKSKNNTRMKELLIEKITVSYDLAFAMCYMHSLGVIYRDMKPENIGFDVRGDVKIFDLGLAKELCPEDLVDEVNELYEMTSNTGSPRYMAPEVCLGDPYNKKADVYSFGILFWQICTTDVPFEHHNYQSFMDDVMLGNERPKISRSMPVVWKNLITSAWSRDISTRPSYEEIGCILEEELTLLQGGDDTRPLSRSEASVGR